MLCPLCKMALQKVLFNNTEIDYCASCFGTWFEEDELQLAKDAKDENLSWLDLDLWQKEHEFHISPRQKLCPSCRLPLYEVRYGKGNIQVDVCNICRGIWLDKKEFSKIIEYLRQRADWEVLHNFSNNLADKFLEIFSGPETIRNELADFAALLKLFAYKFSAQHPLVAQLISEWPK